jgi:hypothetical protein
MKVSKYLPPMREAWDKFVSESKNGTFLFKRAYMEYHSDRFADHSLLVSNERDELIALLPASRAENELSSHAGLTYGGFVVGERMTTPDMLAIFQSVLGYLTERGIVSLRYKTVPYIYHSHPAEEDRYALFRFGARLSRRDVLAVVLPHNRLPYQERRVRKMKQAVKARLSLSQSRDFASFWAILEDNLARVHGAAPVHSLAEITMLAERFPQNIHLHLANDESGPVAGIVIYDTGRVAHVQYIGSSERGRETGALDLLFASLIERQYATSPYFDFGISNENEGMTLNMGLIEQKEGFGARAVVHDFYELRLS